MKLRKILLTSMLIAGFTLASCAGNAVTNTPTGSTVVSGSGSTPAGTTGTGVTPTGTGVTPTGTGVTPTGTQSGGGSSGEAINPVVVDDSKINSGTPGEVLTSGEVTVTKSSAKYESASLLFNNVSGAESYNIYVDGNKVDEKIAYTQIFDSYSRTDLFGLTKGKHNVEIAAVKNGSESNGVKTKVEFDVQEYDRSGYAHFNYTEGVGAYKDDGSLKDNAIVLYVTDQNKNSVSLTYKDTTVTGIGNILNSVGEACGEAGHETECKKVSDGKTFYGKGNTNQGILLKLAEDNIPLVVRFVGIVSDSGLYEPGTFTAKNASKIEGLTAFDSVDCGGSVGDNGHMARMKSAKNLTFEGVGSEATIDGWGFHLICETAHKDLAKNFEVRNLAFINTPEDAIGMEGQEQESTLTITASVERCWVHHNTFISPKISGPAESDKGEGDGSCDFKRGRYFTCSYNYFEDCHKTNLVGSSKTSVQFNLSYHHNIWYNCAARQPLARRANIHFYNNLIYGTTDTVSSLRANSYMFSEGNYYIGCSRPVEYKAEAGATGICKSYNNAVIGCYNNFDATVAKSREEQVASDCKDNSISYVNFDTNPELFYYDSVNKRSDCYLTSAEQARIDCLISSGSAYRTDANKCKLGTDSNITSVSSSATIDGAGSLTIAKGKGVLKVFTVTAPVSVTIAATSKVGVDKGYLLKMDGTLVLALSETERTAVLENGTYVLLSSVALTGANGKNDKETTITKCEFAPYDSAEMNEKLIANYNNAVSAIPATIEFTDECYNAIKNAMDLYATLGQLQSQVTNYGTVTTAMDSYKNLGKTAVEAAIDAIGTVGKTSGAAITNARTLYNTLMSRVSGVTISNYSTLTAAETAFASFAVDACKEAIDAIGTVTLESKTAIETAEGLYEQLDDSQKSDITNYSKLIEARATYSNLVNVKEVEDLITAANNLTTYDAAYKKYIALSNEEKSMVSSAKYNPFIVSYENALIDSIPATVTKSDGETITKALDIYDSLSSENKALITNSAKLTAAVEAYNTILNSLHKLDFEDNNVADEAGFFTFTGTKKNLKSGVVEKTYDGVKYTKALKVESATEITFTSSAAELLIITDSTSITVSVDGSAKTPDSNGVIKVNLTAGTHKITRGSGEAHIYAVIVG